jgi:hypothetical protein
MATYTYVVQGSSAMKILYYIDVSSLSTGYATPGVPVSNQSMPGKTDRPEVRAS